jgi:hypothetical protein
MQYHAPREERMPQSWVVYKMMAKGQLSGPNAVCTQAEWDEMQRHSPGHVLIRSGVASEAEAERLARESPGGTAEPARLKTRL